MLTDNFDIVQIVINVIFFVMFFNVFWVRARHNHMKKMGYRKTEGFGPAAAIFIFGASASLILPNMFIPADFELGILVPAIMCIGCLISYFSTTRMLLSEPSPADRYRRKFGYE